MTLTVIENDLAESRDALTHIERFVARGIRHGDECLSAEDAYTIARDKAKAMVAQRQEATGALKAQVNEIEKAFRPAIQMWEKVGDLLKKAIEDFRRREEATKKAALAAVLEDTTANQDMALVREAVVQASTKPIRSDQVNYRTVATAQVNDPSALYVWLAAHPEEAGVFAPVDLRALVAAHKGGKTLPPGVEIVMEKQLVAARGTGT